MKITAVFTALRTLVLGRGGCTVDNSVLDSFDLNGFLGSWFEIARFDHFFERGMSQTRAQYALRADGDIDVVNTGIKNGAPKTARGRARRTETPALLRVSFFGPFYSDYRVMWLGADGQCALVGSGSDQYLWILSRTPNISDEAKNALLAEARRRRYDTDKLIWVAQDAQSAASGAATNN